MNFSKKFALLDITKRQEQILKECEEWMQMFIDGLRDDEVFYDASFDLENESRVRECNKATVLDYKEIKEINEDRLSVYRHLIPIHARQSGIGDCWLIAALMALSQNPSAIKRIIPEGSYSLKHGIFLVRLFKEGEPHIVVLDGHFPIRDPPSYQFQFVLKGDMWAGLIEKAVAKEYGGYQKLHGAPCVVYSKIEMSDGNGLWEKLVEFRSQNFPMTVSAEAKLVHPGIYEGEGTHGYAILDVCVREGHRMILLGNCPRSRKGKYETIPKLTKEQLDTIDDSKLREKIEKYLFWIDVHEMIDFFDMLTVCRYRHGWYEKKTPINKDANEYLRIHVGERCQMTIERTQTEPLDDYVCFINIHKAAENGEVEEIVASFKAEQLEYCRAVETDSFYLEPGDYIVVYVNDPRTFSDPEDHYWVIRSPTPLDHLSVCSGSLLWFYYPNFYEDSLMQLMKGRVGKEVQKGVFLREYSDGNVVVVMAENKTEKKIAME